MHPDSNSTDLSALAQALSLHIALVAHRKIALNLCHSTLAISLFFPTKLMGATISLGSRHIDSWEVPSAYFFAVVNFLEQRLKPNLEVANALENMVLIKAIKFVDFEDLGKTALEQVSEALGAFESETPQITSTWRQTQHAPLLADEAARLRSILDRRIAEFE